jgi:hypothetical protein
VPDRARGRTTWRAIALGLLLAVPHGYFSIQTPTPTTVSLIYTVVLTLVPLLGFNALLRRRGRPPALTHADLLTIYSMLSISVAVAGHDVMQVLAPVLGHAFWFATPENQWQALFHHRLPDWLVVKDMDVLAGLYEGESSFYTWEHVRAWLTPVAWWSAFLITLMLAMLALNVIISRQWTERERLAYPITQLPVAMISEGRPFWRSPLLWAGIAVSGGIDLVNGLHAFVPTIPVLPVRSIELSGMFTDEPWRAFGWTPVCFFPFAIGLAFFMPLELSFSCWAFYWIWKMQLVLGRALGMRSLPEFPYIKPQASGGYLALVSVALWKGRRHLGDVARSVTQPSIGPEGKTYRLAVVGLALCLGGILAFCVRAGMSIGVAATFFGFYFLLALALTRLRAELGPPVNELYDIGPDQMLPRLVGARRLGADNLVMFGMFWGVNRAHRCNPMPYQLEGIKMARQLRVDARRLLIGMALAGVVGTVVAFWGFLHVHYRRGFGGGFGWEAYRHIHHWLSFMPDADAAAGSFMGVGFGIVMLLATLRQRFLWWPLHPAAYPLASSLNWTMSWMWASIFVSWLLKFAVLRTGGLPGYRRAMPFFAGLILGDYLVGGVWNVWGVLADRYIYTFWH